MKKSIYLLFLFTTAIWGQKESLEIAGMEIKLGITTSELLKNKPDNVKVEMLNNDSRAIISIDEIIYGTVKIDDDKIISISRSYLSVLEADIYNIIDTFYNLLSKAIPQGEYTPIYVSINNQENPKYKARYIKLLKGNRSVDIMVLKNNNNENTIQIWETIEIL